MAIDGREATLTHNNSNNSSSKNWSSTSGNSSYEYGKIKHYSRWLRLDLDYLPSKVFKNEILLLRRALPERDREKYVMKHTKTDRRCGVSIP